MSYYRVVAVLGLSLAGALAFADTPAEIELFNGRDLDGWVVEGTKDFVDKGDNNTKKPVWTVKDGLIHCAGKGYGFLRYDKSEFVDFVLHLEYRMAPMPKPCNSGIGIRTVPYRDDQRGLADKTRPSNAAYEIQLLDDAGKAPDKHGSFSLYRHVAPTRNPAKAAPEWNTVDIRCEGPRYRITVNGEEALDVDQSTIEEIKNKPLKGFVCVQDHGGVIDFRNLSVRPLKVAPKPAP